MQCEHDANASFEPVKADQEALRRMFGQPFTANTKNIRDDVWTTVFTVRQCGRAKLSANDRQLLLK